MVTTLGRLRDAISAMDPDGRGAVPAGAAGNDAGAPPSERLIRNAPAKPPKSAATMATARARATMAEIAPMPRLRRPVRGDGLTGTGDAVANGGSAVGGLLCRKGLPLGGG
jgi:hypothetical protein